MNHAERLTRSFAESDVISSDDPSGATAPHRATTDEAMRMAAIAAGLPINNLQLPADGIEAVVRRPRNDSDRPRRSSTLVFRVSTSDMTAVDDYAKARNWTRSDAVRTLLRAGFKAEASDEPV